MATEFLRLSGEAAADKKIRVIAFDSANSDFFIEHYDVAVLVQFLAEPAANKIVDLHDLIKACEAFRRMPKVSIAEVDGRARCGGSEFLMAIEMRFGAVRKTIVGQPELALGIIPGPGCHPWLGDRVRRAITSKSILSFDKVSAASKAM
jgi:enoyl-CoA hydratase/carnithine racemase